MRTPHMDRFSVWDAVGRNHRGHAFATSVLREIEAHLPERVERSAETGCGKSTILFSNISADHRAFALDDRQYGDESCVKFFDAYPLSQKDRVTFVFGPTQRTLPTYTQHAPYDIVLQDGPHGYPFPELEYFFFYPHIKPGGLLLVDDVSIPTIGRLADFLAEDEMWQPVAVVAVTAIFRRTDAKTFDPEGDGWWTQRYNRRRVSPRREIHLDAGPVVDLFTSQNLDRRLHGD